MTVAPRLGERDSIADPQRMTTDEYSTPAALARAWIIRRAETVVSRPALDMIPASDMPEQRPALYLSPCAVAIYQLQCGTAT